MMKIRKRIGVGLFAGAIVLTIAGCQTPLYPGDERVLPSASLRPWRLPFKIGIARYTMYAVSPEKAFETMQEIDCHYMGLLGGTLSYDANDAEIAAYRAKLAKYGIEVISAGPEYYQTAEQAEKLFRFAKRCGFRTVSVVPYETRPDAKDPTKTVRVESEKMLDVLEKLVKKYDIRAAIHNHGPDIPLLFPTAEAVWARIKDRDPRIGFCLDIGHHLRAGGDPEAAIRKYGSRIYEIHLKNISEASPAGHAMQAPRGMIDELRVFQALVDVGFTGYCLIEYERDYRENAMGLAESMGYYRGVAEGVRLQK